MTSKENDGVKNRLNNQTNPNGVFWVYGLILFLYFIVDYPLSLWAKRLSKRNEA